MVVFLTSEDSISGNIFCSGCGGVGLDNMIRNIILISIILSNWLLVAMGFEYQKKTQFVSGNYYECYHKDHYPYFEDKHRSGDGLGRPPFEQRLLQS